MRRGRTACGVRLEGRCGSGHERRATGGKRRATRNVRRAACGKRQDAGGSMPRPSVLVFEGSNPQNTTFCTNDEESHFVASQRRACDLVFYQVPISASSNNPHS